ncbi:alpha/beta hydrolase [Bradyrhizobium liaoningense]
MADIGPRWREDISGHIRAMLGGFSEVLKEAPKEGVEVRRGIAYGTDPRQQYDLFLPNPSEGKCAAVVFVHGGAFTEGDRNRTEEIYSNVLYFFARHGVVGINVGYRLAPQACYPEATLDLASALALVHRDAPAIGVDPAKVFLMGHSAGGAHAASYAFDRGLGPRPSHELAGLIIVSGRVRAENRPDNSNAKRVESYYQTRDAGKLSELSPVSQVDSAAPPTLVAWSEFENPLIDVHCAELVHRLAQARGKAPPVVWLKSHNHTSIIAHFNTAEDLLGRRILEFIADPR